LDTWKRRSERDEGVRKEKGGGERGKEKAQGSTA
jgi:hypothetical protein